MTKDQAERAIRHLCHEWAKLRGIAIDPNAHPSFEDFFSWVQDNYSPYLTFRTSMSVRDDVENWFDQEFKQAWRN